MFFASSPSWRFTRYKKLKLSHLTGNKALQRERGDYTDTVAESTECCQVIIPAVVLKYITLDKKHNRKTCNRVQVLSVHNIFIKVIGADIVTMDLQQFTLCITSKSCITCSCKDNTDQHSWAHRYMRDKRPAAQRGLLQWPIDHEAVMVADKSWKKEKFFNWKRWECSSLITLMKKGVCKTSPKDMTATAWIAFHRANTHASSDAGLWTKKCK